MPTIQAVQNMAGTYIFSMRIMGEEVPEDDPLILNLQSSSGTQEAAGADVAATLLRSGISWLRPLSNAGGPWVVDCTALRLHLGLAAHGWLEGEHVVRPIFDLGEFLKRQVGLLKFVLAPDGPLAWGYSSLSERTGWARVDRLVAKMRATLESAVASEDFQVVGLLSRDALILLAQEVHNPTLHASPGHAELARDDARGLLDAYLGHMLGGQSAERLRHHARSAFKLALHLHHKRTAAFRDAALCAEATVSLINVVAILEGRRGGPVSNGSPREE